MVGRELTMNKRSNLWRALLVTGGAAVALALLLAASPGTKEDPLATVSYVDRFSRFERVVYNEGDKLLLLPGAEFVLVDPSHEATQLHSFNGLKDEIIDLTLGQRLNASELAPFHHFLNASMHEVVLRPSRQLTVMIKGASW